MVHRTEYDSHSELRIDEENASTLIENHHTLDIVRGCDDCLRWREKSVERDSEYSIVNVMSCIYEDEH